MFKYIIALAFSTLVLSESVQDRQTNIVVRSTNASPGNFCLFLIGWF